MNNSDQNISLLKEAIIQILRYFALFKYPLNTEEIHRYCAIKSSLSEIDSTLLIMLERKELYLSKQKFYSLEPNSTWSDKRELGNLRANKLLAEVYKYVRIIKQFPFVEGIAISGSLSKYYVDEDADIDYFIITKKNHLWIARTLLHIFKKLTFLRSHQHYYCMNYFVDETALKIEDKNIYTAIETATLIPVYKSAIILELKKKNEWIKEFLPNEAMIQDERFLISNKKSCFRSGSEFILNFLFPKTLNKALMRLTDKKWRSKWKKAGYPMENYDQAFYTSIHISKNHPANYQKQVLTSLESNKSDLKPAKCEK